MTKQFTLAHQVRAKFSRVTKLAGAALLAASLFAATAQAAQVPEGVKLAADQTLNLNAGVEFTTLDPAQATDVHSLRVLATMGERLAVEGLEGRSFEPRGAESWEVSPDGLTWTFHLRKDAKWSDGKPVVAADYVYSFRRYLDPKTAAPNADDVYPSQVKNVTAVNKGEKPVTELGVKALDDYTLVFELEKPNPQLLTSVNFYPLRQDLVENNPDYFANPTKLVTNGPFVLTNYKRGDFMDFKANPYYWNAKNLTLTGLHYVFLKESFAAYGLYVQGKLHYVGVPNNLREKLKAERPEEFRSALRQSTSFYAFNLERVPKPVRKALQLLVDARVYTDKILKFGTPTAVFPQVKALGSELLTQPEWFNWPYEKRKEEAVKLLKEAGYTKEKPFELVLLGGTSSTEKVILNAFAGFADNNTGGLVKVKFDLNEFKVFIDKWKKGDFDVRASGFSVNYNYAPNYLSSFVCGSPQNSLKFCSPEFDAAWNALPEAEAKQDDKLRAELVKKMSDALVEEAPVLPVWFPEVQVLVSPAVGGFNPKRPNMYQEWTDLYLVDGKAPKPEK